MTAFGIFAAAICFFFFCAPRAFGRHLAQVMEGFEAERADGATKKKAKP